MLDRVWCYPGHKFDIHDAVVITIIMSFMFYHYLCVFLHPMSAILCQVYLSQPR